MHLLVRPDLRLLLGHLDRPVESAELVDQVDAELGGFDRAIELAKEKAKIGADEQVQLIPYPKPKRLLDLILEQNGMVRAPALPAFLREHLGFAAVWPALAEGGVLAVSPYALTVQ